MHLHEALHKYCLFLREYSYQLSALPKFDKINKRRMRATCGLLLCWLNEEQSAKVLLSANVITIFDLTVLDSSCSNPLISQNISNFTLCAGIFMA